jgi:maleamate amidohydrolase
VTDRRPQAGDSDGRRDGSDARSIARLYEAAGIQRRLGFGQRLAVVVVDLSNAFTSREHPLGSDMDDVVAATVRLLDAARAADLPIFFTTISYQDGAGPGTWGIKSPVLLSLVGTGSDVDIDARLIRRPSEPLITKPGASAFFGTSLASQLTHAGVDTVLVAGGSTSGCVRATVVDAIQLGLRPIVPLECVGDRATGPHEASLIDMDGKYADVLDLAEVLEYVKGLPDPTETLPPLGGSA